MRDALIWARPPAGLSFPIWEMVGRKSLSAQGAEGGERRREESQEPGATSFSNLLCSLPASPRAGRGGARAVTAGALPALARRELTRS